MMQSISTSIGKLPALFGTRALISKPSSWYRLMASEIHGVFIDTPDGKLAWETHEVSDDIPTALDDLDVQSLGVELEKRPFEIEVVLEPAVHV